MTLIFIITNPMEGVHKLQVILLCGSWGQSLEKS